jgi:hypothetical protein
MAMIYISAMETDVPGRSRFDPQAAELLQALADRGYRLHWEKAKRPYAEIQEEIASCDALLAIVDSTWTSSTWMASEVTWALGELGAIETSNRMKAIPVFLYPVDEDRLEKEMFPFGYPGTRVLHRDVTTAVQQVHAAIASGAT